MIDVTDYLNSLSKTEAIAFADLHCIDIGQNDTQLHADWQEILIDFLDQKTLSDLDQILTKGNSK